ncbi:MAG: NAD(P)-dependent glycerol-1-phosphate dehydrogenase [Candidatus Thermoplasmatota archaeon]|nr:NAD(P)-dependent glycerol-1-phosphate dehydrogenase [Euryarchaeota archaeon]MBU4032182.1 NAD(P)-dependent glycerol-1-phosphate dehydrogenase [Candidatus Thermoplasmatota archaeon]MBU4071446.1 NAD(P)-dependent glycerol-1-phosphate dehydrogenase [Candidatus Thermoplasmatota archaeon]MBU4144398.1 NAD(P)-dependent glycerol-1-phosphate dehydrogenase [Candidatus Thermoplasmatota archaeon]MBU4591565.1 NAD(P)-dependent glycerol-1-phosphate dehydrogenase [Candidatus Thermoplasmatota archaeon]
MSDFSKYKIMELPRNVVAGHGVLQGIPGHCTRLGLPQSVLIVADEVTKEIAGQSIMDSFREDGFEADIICIKEADSETISTIQEIAQGLGNIFLAGVGGGRPIDSAKCASFNAGLPFISVPTAASHDGIVSSRASIMVNGVKESLEAQTPVAVFADTGILAKSPFRMLAAGCGDIISNKTAVLDWKLAHKLRNEEFSSYAATLSEITADMLIENADQIIPEDEESAWQVVKALVSSGVAMSIAGSSRPASGAEHKFSHALDRIARKPALHGEQCGIGTIMMMSLHQENWESIRDALETIGAPTKAADIGISRSEVIEALLKAREIKPERYTILGHENLDMEKAEKLAEETGVV